MSDFSIYAILSAAVKQFFKILRKVGGREERDRAQFTEMGQVVSSKTEV